MHTRIQILSCNRMHFLFCLHIKGILEHVFQNNQFIPISEILFYKRKRGVLIPL